MYIVYVLFLSIYSSSAQPIKCDQTPLQSNSQTPSENKGLFKLNIDTQDASNNSQLYYLPYQTYIIKLSSLKPATDTFKWFMITAEDPDVDNTTYDTGFRPQVGTLKTLDMTSRYSERCYNTVENTDSSDKIEVKIHWVSPKSSEAIKRVRLRATVSRNEEVWYTGDNLTVVLEKDDKKAIDSPPLEPIEVCRLKSEARYEVIFTGLWSRLTHPLHYPEKPDDNGYSHMIGASHANDYTLWKQGSQANDGLKLLAEEANTTVMEREIILQMSITGGTRTLIRGRRNHHPKMSEPSHSLFRVDNVHHLFSLVIGMRPSPDWFLGSSNFELCTDDGWLEYEKLPLYPWDAGTMNGVSYESETSVTQPQDSVERVAVGSFDPNSPFYQKNMGDLKPFAYLEVRRLDVYPYAGTEGSDSQSNDETMAEESGKNEEDSDPKLAESKINGDEECNGVWGEWSPCEPENGDCGVGIRKRSRVMGQFNNNYNDLQVKSLGSSSSCEAKQDVSSLQYEDCFLECV